MEKRIRDKLDEERKEEEDRVKGEEERKKRKREAKKRRKEELAKEEEERSKAFEKAELEHVKEHDMRDNKRKEQSNSIFEKFQGMAMQLETADNKSNFLPDSDFTIEPRFMTESDYQQEVEE